MFYDYGFHALFTLFAFISMKLLCFVDAQIIEDTPKPIAHTTPEVDMQFLDMAVHCKFQPNGYVCSEQRVSRRYYFDVHLKRCVRFEYGNCNHSYNTFIGRHECLDACRDEAYETIPANLPATVYCRYQPDFGDCNSYYPSWYYDVTEMRCKGFSYSGCGGNGNRFPTAMKCGDICGAAFTNR